MKKNFKKKKLKNGITILFEKRDVPVVSIAFAFQQGGVNEAEKEKGISHFIEHLMYKGTPKRDSKKIAEEIEKNGGIMNGFTSEQVTAYWCKIPSKKVDVAFEVLGDMVKNSLFKQEDIEKEKKVILEEIKMWQDNPRMHVFDQIHKLMYKKPFGIPLIGTAKRIKSITRKEILEKFQSVYTPNNLILSVVGNVDFGKLVKFAEQNFGNKKENNKFIKIIPKNGERIEKRKGIDQANLVFAYHVPTTKDKRSYAARILTTLMGEGMSSRLFWEIREKRNLAYSIKGDSSISKKFAYNLIYVGTTKEAVNEVKKIIIDEFKKVSETLTEKELDEIKEQLIGNYHISMEDSQAQMINLLAYEVDVDNAEEYYDFEKKIREVKLKDVKNLAKQASKKYSFFALVPY
jgi:predicted Zn-dependent peptidase